jgi:hypothetical protein
MAAFGEWKFMCFPWENGLKSSAIGSPDFQLAQEETRPVAAVKGLLQFSFFSDRMVCCDESYRCGCNGKGSAVSRFLVDLANLRRNEATQREDLFASSERVSE